jgi:hypothetical protein
MIEVRRMYARWEASTKEENIKLTHQPEQNKVVTEHSQTISGAT